MKTLILLLSAILLLNGCTKSKTTSIPMNESVISLFDYSDIENKKITWESIFSYGDDRYFVYIYSEKCGHCNEIKQTIIEYSKTNEYFYFLECSSNIPILDSVDETIGQSDYEEIGILGTPTLLVIENHVLVENIAGSKAIIDTLEK